MQDRNTVRSLFNHDDRLAVGEAIGNPTTLVTPSQAWFLVASAVALGLLADGLFNGPSLGLNLPVWLCCLTFVFVFASRRLVTQVDSTRACLLLAAALISSMTVWRDSKTLCTLDVLLAAGLVMFAVARPSGVGVQRLSPLDIAVAMAAGAVVLTLSAWRLAGRIEWRLLPSFRSEASTVGRGLLVAMPIFLTFGVLFFAADAVFAAEVKHSLSLNFIALRLHLLWTIGGTWLAVAILWAGLVVPAAPRLTAELPDGRRLKTLEVAIVLGPLSVLFGLFVLVELHYLFGGQQEVQRSISLTYSQYARRGFFELVVASILLLPVLTAMNWARKKESKNAIVFGVLAVLLVALLFVVMASAWQRLQIYMNAFGLTELRFYSAAVLPWLAVVFVMFVLSLAMRRSDSFFPGLMLTMVVFLAVLNAVSPDAVIARTNLDRVDSAQAFDAGYTLRLGADAVPVVLDRLDSLDPVQRCFVANSLLRRWGDGDDDVRGWNSSRSHARRAVERQQTRLQHACESGGRI